MLIERQCLVPIIICSSSAKKSERLKRINRENYVRRSIPSKWSDLLTKELLLYSAEAKRKNQDILPSIEALLLLIRSTKDSEQILPEFRKSNAVIKPFLLGIGFVLTYEQVNFNINLINQAFAI